MILRPRKLLAAAAFTTLAACGTSRPAGRAVSYPTPVTNAAAATTTPVALTASDPSADLDVTPTPAADPGRSEAVVAAVPAAPEAAAPRCDENGRPLAGNVRAQGKSQASMGDCTLASQ